MNRVTVMLDATDEGLPVEIFAAKDSTGKLDGMAIMTVPKKCGLIEGDTLRIDGLTLIAVRERSILPIDFAPLTELARDCLELVIIGGGRLAVAEFTPLGLTDAYYVRLTH